MVDLGVFCLKYTFFVFNVIFWIIGTVIIGVGVWAYTLSNEGGLNFAQLRDAEADAIIVFLFANYPLLVIVIGVVIFVLALSGCVGALRENICLLKFFTIVLCLIFVVQMAMGLFLFITLQYNTEKFYTKVDDIIISAIQKYREDINLQELIDELQQQLKCCGATSFDDWENNIYFNCSMESKGSREACGVPFSCCRLDPEETVINVQCGYDIRKEGMNVERGETIYVVGCVTAFRQFISDNYYIIGGVPIGLALLEMFGVLFARRLSNEIAALKAKWKYENRFKKDLNAATNASYETA
ncbi:tetraspanin-5-like [Saccoglossus kowalevskii]|uniref:Tetraspanin n=1 Tax=Saccoglossus kowalevskii TaxID=10224 RepID=A0ABM0MVK7_SACKO|nr:PREDICTED: tetraspanin-5-like [Saccoglossus kowalevskii]